MPVFYCTGISNELEVEINVLQELSDIIEPRLLKILLIEGSKCQQISSFDPHNFALIFVSGEICGITFKLIMSSVFWMVMIYPRMLFSSVLILF